MTDPVKSAPLSAAPPAPPPIPRERVIDLYFMEHRARLLDIAAFLDRVDRALPADPAAVPLDDFRIAAFRRAVALLIDHPSGGADRARRILQLLSDPTLEPIAQAGSKAAAGAHPLADSSARSDHPA